MAGKSVRPFSAISATHEGVSELREQRWDAAERGYRLHTLMCRGTGLPPTWTAAELGKRTSIERFFGRALVVFHLQRPPVFGWSAVETRMALTYAAVWVIALSAWRAGRLDLIRSPRLVLAHVWEGVEV